MKLIVGLGNPGKKYDRTRHNVGFLVLDELADRLGLSFREKTSCECWMAETTVADEHVILLKPNTFMNASGNAVQKVMKKSGATAKDLLVVYDEANLPFGDIRVRENGSAGGHNGMASILELVSKGTAVKRVRIGIDRPPHPDMALEAWVLGAWSESEAEALPEVIQRAADAVQKELAS